MFDQPYFQEDWTPLDIEKGIKPFYRGWDGGQYRKYLTQFGLDAKKKFSAFSRGMKMKLSFAVGGSKLPIADPLKSKSNFCIALFVG